MAKPRNEDVEDANKSISRPDEKRKRAGALTATGRYGVAAMAIVDQGTEKSETERAAEKASRNDRR